MAISRVEIAFSLASNVGCFDGDGIRLGPIASKRLEQ